MALTDTADDLLTRACALVDRAERGKLALTGTQAREFLQGQVSNDVERLADGQGCYATFLTQKGKMLGDLRILWTGCELLLDCERCALQALFNMIRHYKLGYDVELHKRTLQRGLLSVIGPEARAATGAGDLPEVEHAHRDAELAGVPVRLIVTDLGVDVLCEAERTDEVKAALGVAEVSQAAGEVLRVESGRPRYGVDLDESVMPQEGGLNERAVSFDKGCYVGQETVARLHWRGKPNRGLRGVLLSEPAAAGTALRLGERTVGTLTSPTQSPRFGPIGLALLRRQAEPGAEVTVGEGPATARVCALPF